MGWIRKRLCFLLVTGLIAGSSLSGQVAVPKTPPGGRKPAKSQGALASPLQGGLTGPVKYWAEHIYFSLPRQTSILEKNARIVYQDIILTAGRIEIDWRTNSVTATGIADSTDSLGNAVVRQIPVLTQKGNEPISGARLEYNFQTQRGRIFQGKTRMEPGYYYGQEIEKVGKETLYIKNGRFTSCELDHPHYYFKSARMRVRVNKVAVAKPIIMYIADVPVFALPFGVFPLKKGRRSGVILPTFGQNTYGGRYLDGFGYYWAASQYWDATFLGTFYEKTGMVYRGEFRYAKRYAYNGNINGSYSPKDVLTGASRQRWLLNFNHSQRIGETFSIFANGRFQSDKQVNRQYFNDINERLNQSIAANLVMRKSWPKSRNTLTVSMRRSENLQSGQIDYEIPNIAFSQPSRSLFPFKSGPHKKLRWYNSIKYSYNTNLISRGNRRATVDTANVTHFRSEMKSAWKHDINASFTAKFFKYISTQQFIRFQELWVPEYQNYRFVDSLNAVTADTINSFRARHTFSLGVSANTTFYGLWEIPFLPVKLIRHKMDPFISFSYTPDFANPRYGYVQTFRDTTGREIKRDRFAGNIFGGTPLGASQLLSFGVRNLFQGKILKNGQEKKIDLFRLNSSSSYNFLADSLKWGNIITSLQARPSHDFDFSFSAVHTLYKPTSQGTGRRNSITFPRLLNFNLNARIHLAPPPPGEKKKVRKDTTVVETGRISPTGNAPDITRNRTRDALRGFKLPWDLNLGISYNQNKNNINNTFKSLNVNANARFELTRHWRIDYNARYDLIKKNINFQSFSIYRDLHHWEMYFSWQPNSVFSSYRLEIRIKESALRDIKLTKTSGGRTVF